MACTCTLNIEFFLLSYVINSIGYLYILFFLFNLTDHMMSHLQFWCYVLIGWCILVALTPIKNYAN